MKKQMHRLLSLILSLVLVVGLIPGTMTAHAASEENGAYSVVGNTEHWNITVTEDGILKWKCPQTAVRYRIEFATYKDGTGLVYYYDDIPTNSCNLKEILEKAKIESGVYPFVIEALLENGNWYQNTIDGLYSVSLYYVSALPKLAAPQNVRWDASGKQTWDSVPGADKYEFSLYDSTGSLKATLTTNETSVGYYAEDGYYFTVAAIADGYRDSNPAESPKRGTPSAGAYSVVGNTEHWNITVTEDGILKWECPQTAVRYRIEFATYKNGAGLVRYYDDIPTNSCNLKEILEEAKIESGVYPFVIEALLENGNWYQNTIDGLYSVSLYYVSALPKLAEPQNPRWDASGKQTWDSVPGADKYEFRLYDSTGSLKATLTTNETSVGYYTEDGYYFTVAAIADGYRDSNAAESPKYKVDFQFTNQSPAMPAGKKTTSITATVGEEVTYIFDSTAVPAGYTIEKTGSLAAPGMADKAFTIESDGSAKLTHTYTKSGLYTLIETLTLKKGETIVATKQNVFYVTVSPAPVVLSDIEITRSDANMAHANGQEFSKNRIEVTANYSDGTSKVLGADEYTVEYQNGTALKTGDTKVTIKYTEGVVTKSVDQAVTVVEAQYAAAFNSLADLDFGTAEEGYEVTNSWTKTIAVTNIGSDYCSVDYTLSDSSYFTVTVDATIEDGGMEPDTTGKIYVTPKSNLSAGVYTATIRVYGMGALAGMEHTFTLKFVVTDGHEHIYGDTFNGSNDTYHWKECIADDCPAADKGRKDVTVHVWDFENPVSDSATCTKDGEVAFECICGAETTGYSPAKGHDWSAWNTEETATCKQSATHTRTCANECHDETKDGLKTQEKEVFAGHYASENWTTDSSEHWKVCGYGCGTIVVAKDSHEYSDDADATCNVCGYERVIEGGETPAPTEYTITVTGGTASANKAVAGTVITLTVDESAIPAGKVFDKWEVVSGGVTITDNKFTMPANAVEIRAIYKDASVVPVTYTVTFDSNGGSAVAAQTVNAGEKATKPADPTKEGFDFVGWTFEDKEWNFDNAVTGDMTLVAVWKEKEVTPPADEDPVYGIVVNNGKSYTGAGVEITAAEEGTKITIKADEAPEGKEFDKWVVVSGTITLADATKAETTFDMPAERVEVTATYKDKEVTPPADDDGDQDDDKEEEPTKPTEPQKPSDNPQTGDNSNILMWFALLFVSAVGIAVTTVLGKKRFFVK